MDEIKIMREEFFNKCRLKALEKIMIEFNYDNIMENKEYAISYVPEYLNEEFDNWMSDRQESLVRRHKYAMFTINFIEDISFRVMKKKVLKAISKKWVKNPIIRWECRGTEQHYNWKWKGIHVHIRCEIDGNKNCYRCVGEMYNTFKDIVGCRKHVNARYGDREDSFIEYCKGYKRGKKKEFFDEDEALNSEMGDIALG